MSDWHMRVLGVAAVAAALGLVALVAVSLALDVAARLWP